MATYLLHGLRVRSELALGIAVSSHQENGRDIEVTIGHYLTGPNDEPPAGVIIAKLETTDRCYYAATDQGDQYFLRIHGLCDFVVNRDLTTATCHPAPDALTEQIVILVRGTLIAFLLGLQGHAVLHASAVEHDHGAVAFVGHSGMGKSTLAALACRDGSRFISDDLLRLDAETPPSWVGASAELRLRPGAIEITHGKEQTWSAHPTIDERIAVTPERTDAQSGRLSAIIIPSPDRNSRELHMTRIEAVDAMFLLNGFQRIAWILPSALATHFDAVSRIANTIPVFHASVPWGPPFAQGLGAQLLEQVLTN